VGLQNKDRWQWITQMFHCTKSAICCASNMTVSKILSCLIPLQLSNHLPYGMKRSAVGDHCSISYGSRREWCGKSFTYSFHDNVWVRVAESHLFWSH